MFNTFFRNRLSGVKYPNYHLTIFLFNLYVINFSFVLLHHLVNIFSAKLNRISVSKHPQFMIIWTIKWTSQVVLVVKNPPANAGDIRDAGLIPGLGRWPGGGHGNPLQYSCLENPMDREAWQVVVHRVAKSWT